MKQKKINLTNVSGKLSKAEMKKIFGGSDDSFGGRCTIIGRGCDAFNPCNDTSNNAAYCFCSAGICMNG